MIKKVHGIKGKLVLINKYTKDWIIRDTLGRMWQVVGNYNFKAGQEVIFDGAWGCALKASNLRIERKK